MPRARDHACSHTRLIRLFCVTEQTIVTTERSSNRPIESTITALVLTGTQLLRLRHVLGELTYLKRPAFSFLDP